MGEGEGAILHEAFRHRVSGKVLFRDPKGVSSQPQSCRGYSRQQGTAFTCVEGLMKAKEAR